MRIDGSSTHRWLNRRRADGAGPIRTTERADAVRAVFHSRGTATVVPEIARHPMRTNLLAVIAAVLAMLALAVMLVHGGTVFRP